MELLIAWAVIAICLKKAVVDVAAMATGKTPPSHAYQMAKLNKKAPKKKAREVDQDPDTRAGLKRVAAHWYRDACEDLDAARERRRLSKPERKAAKEARKREKQSVIARAKDRLTGEDTAGADRPRPTPPDAPIPDVPDNVIPLADRRAAKEQTKEDQREDSEKSGEEAGDQQSQEQKKEEGAEEAPSSSEKEKPSPESPTPAGDGAPDTNRDTKQSPPEELEYAMSDQAGLTPHLMALASARVHCDRAVADIDRIRAQMEEGGVGQSVTDQAGTATDAVKAAEHQLGNAELILETLNREVLEALASARFQAGDKSYLTPESSGQQSNEGGRS